MRQPVSRHILAAVVVTAAALPLSASMPYPIATDGQDPEDYAAYLFRGDGVPLPAQYGTNATWWLTDHRGDDLMVVYNPQEFYGVRGMGANRAWEVSTGRPDVIVAILDSGAEWNRQSDCNLLRKYYLNRGELPVPDGGPNPDDTRFGGYDVNSDGVFNVADYWTDSRVVDLNGNAWIDPEDLILTFTDGVDDDGNGYVDDVSGWDFFEGDNDPQDDVAHGHGSHQASHAAAEAALPGEDCPAGAIFPFNREPGPCPNCMVLPLRVGDSFVADANHFAEAVVYAADNGAQVVECALGTLNHTSFGQEAVDYAHDRGLIINTSAADEAAGHHNWPAAYEHTLVHNSVRDPELAGTSPRSYLYLNGCTNYGSYIHAAVPSQSCSSEATGLAAGVSGLLVSAALNAVERGSMSRYIQDDGSEAAFPISPAEAEQLWRLAADDIDFSTFYPDHAFSDLWEDYEPSWWWDDEPYGEWNNYHFDSHLFSTHRYQTIRGWDYFTGYGRINAARLLRFIGRERDDGQSLEYLPGGGPYSVGHDPILGAQDRIPPEAEISWPPRWHQYGYGPGHVLLLPDDPAQPAEIVVRGRVAANRVTAAGGSFDYVLEWAPGPQGAPSPEGLAQAAADSEERSPGPWTEAARVTGLAAAHAGELGRIAVAEVDAAVAANPDPFEYEGDPTSFRRPERWAVRLRLRVLAHPANPGDVVNNEAVQQKQVDVYPASELILRADLGVAGRRCGGSGSPSLHDLDGDARDELLLPTDDGVIHAYTDVAAGTELPGWPVTTFPLGTLPAGGDNAFSRGEVASQVPGSLMFGTVAVADLGGDGTLQVLAGDCEGRLYAWQADGNLRAGFPVTVDYALSAEPPCTADNVPSCDDAEPGKIRDNMNRRDWAFMSAPSVGELDPDHPGLEIVAAASDSHLYAWHADGSPVDGWPVILRDPAKVAAMDPVSRRYVYADDSGWLMGSKATITPSLGDIDGDGDLEAVAVVNEGYAEEPNADLDDTLIEWIIDEQERGGNGRIYALHHTGAASPGDAASEASGHTQDQAYVPGWPVATAQVVAELLPTAGQGSNAQPALADFDCDGTLEIVTASHYGPGYILDHDGGSFLGMDGSKYDTLERDEDHYGDASSTGDESSLPTLGGIAVGSMSDAGHLTIAAASAGIHRMLDVLLVARQRHSEDHLGLWSADHGGYEVNAPLEVNDLQFFAAPVIADLDGDGRAEVIQQSSFSDLLAASLLDTQDSATVRHTGGWAMGSAAPGRAPLGDDGAATLSLISLTREGYLRVFPTTTPAQGEPARRALGEWPEAGHDAHNTGNYHTDAERPHPVHGLEAEERSRSVVLRFTASGDDRDLGRSDHYQVRAVAGEEGDPDWSAGTPLRVDTTVPAAAGDSDSVVVRGLQPGTWTLMLRAFDEAGNGSAPAVVTVTVPGYRGEVRGRHGG